MAQRGRVMLGLCSLESHPDTWPPTGYRQVHEVHQETKIGGDIESPSMGQGGQSMLCELWMPRNGLLWNAPEHVTIYGLDSGRHADAFPFGQHSNPAKLWVGRG